MNLDKLKETMRNFDEQFLKELLEDLKDVLLEWSINKNLMTKNSMIDIILSVRGLNLFKNEKFRYNYFCSVDKISVIKTFLGRNGILVETDDQLVLAKKATAISFQDNLPYRYLIFDYFGITEYEFQSADKEPPVDVVQRTGGKFYELFDYQYMIKQQVINDLENKEKHLYKILVHMPTGTGKTKTTMHIIAHYLDFISKGKGTVIWIAHSDELLKQAYNTFVSVWSHLALFEINVYKGWVSFPTEICDGILFTSIQALQQKLVVWTKCTRVDYKKWKTCVDHMSKDLGRKYRKFLCSEQRSISMIELIGKEHKDVLPNDPLYLTPKALECVPSNLNTFINNKYVSKPFGSDPEYDTCLFEIYKAKPDSGDSVDLDIIYEENGEKKKGTAHITYSIVKKEYYSPAYLKTDKKPGSLPYGSNSSVLSGNTGISIVRNDREIQFGSFGFYDTYNTPDFRWWGVEISFSAEELDTAFGVSNNKQSVDLKPLTKEEMKEYASDEIKTVWHQLAQEIIPTIKAMTARNSQLRSETEVKDDPTPSTSSTISTVADGEEVLIVDAPTDVAEIVEAAKEELIAEGVDAPSDEQIKKLIDSKVRVVPVFNKGRRDSFVDTKYAAGTLSIILNANHDFYNKLVKRLIEDENEKVPFELFLIAVMKSIKNLDLEYNDAMDKLMYDINDRISKYMMEYNKNNG